MDLEPAEKWSLNRFSHTVRASQAVLQYGVGAMVDFPDQTLMTAAPEYWEERVIQIHDERLEKVLHVDYFGMPGGIDDFKCREGISYARFPEWYFCPKCRKFRPIDTWIEDYKRKARTRDKENDPYMVKHMKCPACYQDLVVARIVTACEHGHIDDFPWVKWVHCQNIGGPKEICTNPVLTFKTGASATEGLEGLVVTCESCHARSTLKGAFDSGKFEMLDKKHGAKYNFRCTGRHPWKNKRESCTEYPKVLQRGSSSVYFPVTESSLVIPPYSSIITNRIENSSAFSTCKDIIAGMVRTPGLTQEIKDSLIVAQINAFAEKIALEIGVPNEQVTPVLERKWRQPASEEYSTMSVKYRAEEYDALSGEVSLGNGDFGEFQRETTDIADYDLPYVKRISLIHKVREVQALIGFSRIKPADRSESSEKQPNIVSVKEPETNWYPAYEVRGEGIFIEFDSNEIDKWRSQNTDLSRRIEILNDNYKKSFIGANNPRTITSKYVLLHTISHLLIKQLSFECGYSIASLKERIYCSEPSEGKEMSGILIYTASGDSEGTMGGLVRQGRPDTFPSIFKKAIESGMTCSNDPVCSLSLGQGRDSLNLSACYSCTLVPETSCEEFNIFLDRGTVVGTFNNHRLGFFYEHLYGLGGWHSEATDAEAVKKPVAQTVQTIIPKTGTDMRDVPYNEIWNTVGQWVDNHSEKEKVAEFSAKAGAFDGKEKPIYECEFVLTGDASSHKATLLWKNSKIVYFSSEDRDEYEIARSTDWTCFCGDEIDLDVQEFSKKIKDM